MMTLAPIVLFVYNRPEHTLSTLNALEKNNLASESELFVFSDGAKSNSDRSGVEKVREIIKRPFGFKKITLIENSENLGLAANVIKGVTQIIAEYGKAIVFEDDLISSRFALQYFNDALNEYENAEQVMHISGYLYPIQNKENLAESFFFRTISSWGWATWARAWQHFDSDIYRLTKDFGSEEIRRFSIDGKENFWKQVNEFKRGEIDSWAIRWYLSVFNQGGLSLYPRESMIQNIGLDGSGIHSGINESYRVILANKPVTFFPKEINEDPEIYEKFKYFFAHRKGNLWQRGIRYLRNKLF